MNSHTRHNALEFELFREQAGALGIAGKQLRQALLVYSKHVQSGGVSDQVRTAQLLDDIASKVYTLMLQRELVGFVHNNVDWINASFDLPAEIWPRVGALRES